MNAILVLHAEQLKASSVPLELDLQIDVVTPPMPAGTALVTYRIANCAAVADGLRPAMGKLCALRQCVAGITELEQQRGQILLKIDKVVTKKGDFARELTALASLDDESKPDQSTELQARVAAADENLARRRKQLGELDERLQRSVSAIETADPAKLLATLRKCSRSQEKSGLGCMTRHWRGHWSDASERFTRPLWSAFWLP